MTIICTVAADFVRGDGEIFRVTGREIGVIKDAPDWIKDTLIFKWLDKDGSIKYVNQNNRIEAENDPLSGVDAEGKRIPTKEEEAVNDPSEGQETASKKKTTRKKAEKKDDAE